MKRKETLLSDEVYETTFARRRIHTAALPIEVIEPEIAVVLPRVFEWTLVPGPEEVQ